MPLKNGWTGGQYSIYRALLGLYLFVHFVRLIPWGREVFSNAGVLPNASASPLLHLFPNVLALWDGRAFIAFFLILGTLLAVVMAFGWHDRAAALALRYLWACLLGRNPLIGNPSLPFVGWLLLTHAVLPSAPYGSWAARGRPDPRGNWQMPSFVFALAWALMAVGYTYSGYTKLVSPSWVDGSALFRVLQNPLARPTFLRILVLGMPFGLLRTSTWGALGLELGFAPRALCEKRGRGSGQRWSACIAAWCCWWILPTSPRGCFCFICSPLTRSGFGRKEQRPPPKCSFMMGTADCAIVQCGLCYARRTLRAKCRGDGSKVVAG
jgi:hypothetical protein